jgi:hypothetical protein
MKNGVECWKKRTGFDGVNSASRCRFFCPPRGWHAHEKKMAHQNFTPPKISYLSATTTHLINIFNNRSLLHHRQSLPAAFWASRPPCYWWNPAISCFIPHILIPRWWLRPSEEIFECNSSEAISNFQLGWDQEKRHNWNSISGDFLSFMFWRCCFY